MYDWVIQGATVIDGSGAPGYVADVVIKGGKIDGIGKIDPEQGKDTISGKGKVLAPGFIETVFLSAVKCPFVLIFKGYF